MALVLVYFTCVLLLQRLTWCALWRRIWLFILVLTVVVYGGVLLTETTRHRENTFLSETTRNLTLTGGRVAAIWHMMTPGYPYPWPWCCYRIVVYCVSYPFVDYQMVSRFLSLTSLSWSWLSHFLSSTCLSYYGVDRRDPYPRLLLVCLMFAIGILTVAFVICIFIPAGAWVEVRTSFRLGLILLDFRVFVLWYCFVSSVDEGQNLVQTWLDSAWFARCFLLWYCLILLDFCVDFCYWIAWSCLAWRA